MRLERFDGNACIHTVSLVGKLNEKCVLGIQRAQKVPKVDQTPNYKTYTYMLLAGLFMLHSMYIYIYL